VVDEATGAFYQCHETLVGGKRVPMVRGHDALKRDG
jgi:hypothetical protein